MTSEIGSVKESIALQSKDSSKENSVPAEHEVDLQVVVTLQGTVNNQKEIASPALVSLSSTVHYLTAALVENFADQNVVGRQCDRAEKT